MSIDDYTMKRLEKQDQEWRRNDLLDAISRLRGDIDDLTGLADSRDLEEAVAIKDSLNLTIDNIVWRIDESNRGA